MGKCVGTHRRVEHFSGQKQGEVYDKFGNLIAGNGNRIEFHINGRKIVFTHPIQKVMVDYEFLETDVLRLWKKFNSIDKAHRGYITIGQIFTHLNERHYSIIGPYLERFFDLIDKDTFDRCTFDEFLPALVTFCLFSKDEMTTFVFNMLDRDRDNEISKRDLFRLFSLVVDSVQVFPTNNMRAIELIALDRGDKITKQEFINVVAEMQYIVFPSFRLQNEMKESFGGYRFWRKCQIKLQKKEQERKMITEREKFFERSKKKKEIEYEEKLEFYEMKVKIMNEFYYKREIKRRHRMAKVRVRGRRCSDGLIGVVFPIEDYHENLDKLLEKKKTMMEDNPYDNPIMRDRQHYSFLWDRYPFYEADNIEDIIKIDPTDKNINMQEEIQKFLKKTKKAKKIENDSFHSDETSFMLKTEAEGASNSSNKQSHQPQSQSVKVDSTQSQHMKKQDMPNDIEEIDQMSKSQLLRIAMELSDVRGGDNQKKVRRPQKLHRQQSDSQLLADQHNQEDYEEYEEDEDRELDEIEGEEVDDDPYGDEISIDERERIKAENSSRLIQESSMLRKSHLPQSLKGVYTSDPMKIIQLQRIQTQKSIASQRSEESKHSSHHQQNQQPTANNNNNLESDQSYATKDLFNKQRHGALPPIKNPSINSRIGDETLSMLSKQFPVARFINKKGEQMMGDETLSMLSKQFPVTQGGGQMLTQNSNIVIDPKISPAKKFKMMRQQQQQQQNTNEDGASTIKSKWTMRSAAQNFGQGANQNHAAVNNNQQQQHLRARSRMPGESVATQEILGVTMSSEVSFDTQLYQQYDVNSVNQSQLNNQVNNRLRQQAQNINVQQENGSGSSKKAIKEEEGSHSEPRSKKKLTSKPNQIHSPDDDEDEESYYEDEEEEEEEEEGDDQDVQDEEYESEYGTESVSNNVSRLQMQSKQNMANNYPNLVSKKTNYEVLRNKNGVLNNGGNYGQPSEQVLYEAGQKIVHAKSKPQLQVNTHFK